MLHHRDGLMPTFGAGGLKVVSGEGTPADWEDVSGVVATVVIESSTPSVKGDQHLDTAQCADCGWADVVGVFAVHGLQLHAHFEGVLLWSWRLLLGSFR